jgi:hypothetical protein
LVIRPAQADDYGAWLALWRGYCAALDGAVPDAVTEGVWRRILRPDEPPRLLPRPAAGGLVVA